MGDVIMTDTATAAFVLRAATDAGILLGTDGHELLVSPPRYAQRQLVVVWTSNGGTSG
jgi:hypothetical protein